MGWYDSSWLYRVKVSPKHTKVPNTDQLNYPGLFTEANFPDAFWEHIKADGSDLVATSDDEETKLKRELVSIDVIGKKMELHVKIPVLSHSEDTEIYLYYGNAAAPETNDLDTWDANFVFVSHMRDDPDSSHIRDSSQYGNHGTKAAADNPIEADGKIGKAQDFVVADRTVHGNDTSLRITGSITLEAWVRREANQPNSGVISKYTSGTQSYLLFLYSNKTGFLLSPSGTSAQRIVLQGNTVLTQDVFHYLVGAYNGVDARVYLDGNLDKPPLAYALGIFDSIIPLKLGTHTSGYYLNGKADEVRISDIDRSADWIMTCFNNQDDPASFYSVEEETSLQPGLVIALIPKRIGIDFEVQGININIERQRIGIDVLPQHIGIEIDPQRIGVAIEKKRIKVKIEKVS